MVQKARTLKYRWMKKTALFLFPVPILLGMAGFIALLVENGLGPRSLVLLTLAGLAALAGPGLPLLRYLLIRDYDPNYDPPRNSFR
jgi:hypothetical protein